MKRSQMVKLLFERQYNAWGYSPPLSVEQVDTFLAWAEELGMEPPFAQKIEKSQFTFVTSDGQVIEKPEFDVSGNYWEAE